jgi:hypothetical protein
MVSIAPMASTIYRVWHEASGRGSESGLFDDKLFQKYQ